MLFTPTLKQLKPNGKIVYEYNPFRNYRDNNGKIGDLITPKLNFDLEHPVQIECQHSYDGSVNLILNDGLNPMKLINSRFTVRQNNTYEIIDRTGSADTNLYDDSQFDIDTSLYKKINTIPEILFTGISYGGNLPVGNYNFYFKYTDVDDNETDFIGESGNVVCHIGNLNDPKSIRSGLENENSGKTVQFLINNLDSGYDYIKVYYTRQTSGLHTQPTTEAKVLIKKFKCKGDTCVINVTGFEETLDVSLEEINKEYFLAETSKSVAQCKNRLFLANLTKPVIDYMDFSDISLRMLPSYGLDEQSVQFGQNYDRIQNTYYDVKNIYGKVGYWGEEIYRLGVVYILSDNSLSPVFNIRGGELSTETFTQHEASFEDDEPADYNFLYEYSETKEITDKRRYIEYDETTGLIANNTVALENAKGVIRIKETGSLDRQFYLRIAIDNRVIDYLKSVLKVKGFFFVRQKRIPNILTQAYVIGHDSVSGIPLIPIYEGGLKFKAESFTDGLGFLSNYYEERLFTVNENHNNEVAICPDYSVRLELYNNFFTDTDYVVKPVARGNLTQSYRHFYVNEETLDTTITKTIRTVPIIGVPDGISVKRTKNSVFCSRAGSTEGFDFKTVGEDFELSYEDSDEIKNNIVRGSFGPFLGISGYKGNCGEIINIYIPNYSEKQMPDYFKIRMEDQSPYYAITDRIDINKEGAGEISNIYRGDCYICLYTHRLNRNFADLNAPTADKIVDSACWKNNYKPETAPEKMADINIGDLNAVLLGNWITFTVKSSINLSIRDEDSSYISESLLMGNNRSFYPLSEMSTDGNYKIPESSVVNTGISAQNSQRVNFAQDAVPYIKNNFLTRIAYSDISITDAFKNGYRTFQAMAYQDYPTTYGGIMKIMEMNDLLLVVFEHGIGLLPVNERVIAGSGLGGDVFINANKVLPDTINMISSDYGSLWSDSVIKGAYGIYGVDTVAKKIWRYSTNGLEILSDFTVLKFLNDNISLTERELTPFIGVRNVKTHYNAYKQDIMFTFYDNKDKYEETVWNLCYNEKTGKFTTFYSWLPSFSANIDNIFFTFDRDTSKKLGKLSNTLKDGIVANTVLLDDIVSLNNCKEPKVYYIQSEPAYYEANENTIHDAEYIYDDGKYRVIKENETATHIKVYTHTELKENLETATHAGNEIHLFINEEELPSNWERIEFSLEKTLFNSDKCFLLKSTELTAATKYITLKKVNTSDIDKILREHKIIPLNVKAIVYESASNISGGVVWKTFKKLLYFTKEKYLEVPANKHLSDSKLTTAFWKHGQSGIIDVKEPIKPCKWYNKLHPFELEFVVNASDPSTLKTFDTMQILSNNVPPESFHYTIIGDTYDFAEDKPNMYKRQEATKHAYQLNGSDITYDSNYGNIKFNKLIKSTLFPTFYTRIDKIDEIYDSYIKTTHSENSVDYCHLAGAELIHDASLDQFSIVNHLLAIDIKSHTLGRLRGNMLYLNDTWHVLINPINLVQKNEESEDKIRLNIYYPRMLNDITTIDEENIQDGYVYDTTSWGNVKEVKLKDKYMKCRIRYKGDKLSLITGVRTKYRI